MHTTRLTLKDGRDVEGVISSWRPLEGYFVLFGMSPIRFVDVASMTTESVRTGDGIADRDELARARDDGWDGT